MDHLPSGAVGWKRPKWVYNNKRAKAALSKLVKGLDIGDPGAYAKRTNHPIPDHHE